MPAGTLGDMVDCLLRLSSVTAGLDARGGVQIYYGHRYVGAIHPAGELWRVWLHSEPLGDFRHLGLACRAVAEWYYGPGAEIPVDG